MGMRRYRVGALNMRFRCICTDLCANRNPRRTTTDLPAIAVGTTDQATFQLRTKIISTSKPAFEAVFIFAA